ncbi:MAG TPA: DinB family protein [Mucilaginibacter sp.]|jgi:hypothetical protein|nr:DinB family protein [Mucilaginibacter sp.]
MKNDAQNEIANAKEELLRALNLFDQENINIIPFEGSWTGGQVAEHILKSISGILETIKGPIKPTDRDPEEHVKQLGDIFLNMDIKMKSPDFIIPSDDPKEKTSLSIAISSTLDGIKQVAENDDLTVTCSGFDMPMMGPLTRLEWISFASFHTRRHTQQLKNIAHHLKKQTA